MIKCKCTKKILIGLGVVVLLVALLGFFLPKEQHIEREIVINKPRAEVFAYLNSIRNQQAWSPWLKMDPHVQVDYSGPAEGVGATSTWDGNKDIGKGAQEFKAVKKNERIDMELRFERPMEGVSQAHFITEDAGKGQTRVKWGFDSSTMKFPCNIMSAFMKPYMNKIFDDGLKDLKNQLENG